MRAMQVPPGRSIGSGVDNVPGRRRGEFDKTRWIGACGARLAALRPGLGSENARATARQMWPEVGHFDPAMAAELEHESWPTDD